VSPCNATVHACPGRPACGRSSRPSDSKSETGVFSSSCPARSGLGSLRAEGKPTADRAPAGAIRFCRQANRCVTGSRWGKAGSEVAADRRPLLKTWWSSSTERSRFPLAVADAEERLRFLGPIRREEHSAGELPAVLTLFWSARQAFAFQVEYQFDGAWSRAAPVQPSTVVECGAPGAVSLADTSIRAVQLSTGRRLWSAPIRSGHAVAIAQVGDCTTVLTNHGTMTNICRGGHADSRHLAGRGQSHDRHS